LARYQPGLLGGLFIGVLSSLRFIGGFNVCGCLWVVTGGVLTTYLLGPNPVHAIPPAVGVRGPPPPVLGAAPGAPRPAPLGSARCPP
jgi:hypothetical protein